MHAHLHTKDAALRAFHNVLDTSNHLSTHSKAVFHALTLCHNVTFFPFFKSTPFSSMESNQKCLGV